MEKKVLIVDDEERVVQSIAGVLEDEGFRVVKARSGEEAIKIFQQDEPDITLLDIWMPGMDGIEVLKRLKWIAPDCQVIMISGHATISTDKLAEFRPVIQKALKIAGNGSSEFQYLCQLTTNIQKSDDILIGALQKRKASVARSIQTVQNEKKLQHYIR